MALAMLDELEAEEGGRMQRAPDAIEGMYPTQLVGL